MKENKRVFLIVLDSVGIGELPDAESYGDCGSNTLLSAYKSAFFNCPNLKKLGLFNLPTLSGANNRKPNPTGAYGYSSEKSRGKDTVVGHWEISGIYTPKAFPTYPNGFPDEVITEFEKLIGTKILCNKPYSGTEVIRDYGEEHIKTGYPIVYTSADSVFQIACHKDIVPLEKLYGMCETARRLLCGEHNVARVIARPFEGKPGNFYRTSERKDYAITPPEGNMLDKISERNMDVIGVGKIENIFVARGITKSFHTSGNSEGIQKIFDLQSSEFNGLAFINLVDFDMIYGHRNDIDGYAKALTEFDAALNTVLENIKENDIYIITADHGCDPGTPSTDHSREYIPILCFGKKIKPGYFGMRRTFSDIGATVCDYLGAELPENGDSFLKEIL